MADGRHLENRKTAIPSSAIDFDEIWHNDIDPSAVKNSNFSKFKMADGRHDCNTA